MKHLLYTLFVLFFTTIAKVIQSIFGIIDWEPPRWIHSVATPIHRTHEKTKNFFAAFRTNKPKAYARFIAGFWVLVAASIGGYIWYKSLPEPHYITFTVKEPAPTPLEEEAKPFPLEVYFSGSAAPLETVGKELIKGIHVEPQLKGKWVWETDARLSFQPEGEWTVGTPYKVKFEKNLFAKQVRIKEHQFSFSSPRITPTIQNGEFYEDPTDPKMKQIVTTVSFTHPVDKTDFERHITLLMRIEPEKNFDSKGVQKLGYKVSYNEKASEAYIRSEIIAVPERDGEVLVSLSPGIRAQSGGGGSEQELKRTVQVPGIENYFKILSVRSSVVTDEKSYEAKRIMSIETTAGVSQKELEKNVTVLLLPNDPKYFKDLKPVSDTDLRAEDPSDGDGEGEYEGEEEAEEGSEDYSESSAVESNVVTNCPWKVAGQVTEAALQVATPVQVTWLPTDKDFSTLHTLSFEAEENRCLLVQLKKGIKSFGDFKLASDRSFLADTKPFPAEVKIMHEGSLLALSGEKKISVMARNLEAVRFRLYRVLPRMVHHLISQSYGDIPKPNFYYNLDLDNLSEIFTTEQTLPPEGPGRPQYTVFDFGTYLRNDSETPKGLFVLEATGWNVKDRYETGPREKRLIFVTDIGFLVKDNQDATHEVYVQSLSEGVPVEGATVSILGKNGMPIFSAQSDIQGHVHFASYKDFTREKTPTVYVVEKGGDYSFLPYNKGNRQLNLSRFDTGGEFTESDSEALQAYLFSDRGIYRPGEDAHIGMIVKRRDWQTLPTGLPLKLSVYDPRGGAISEQNVKIEGEGFSEVTIPFSDLSLTGTYTAQLSVYNKKRRYPILLGSTILRVEEFQPDRLQIQTQFVGPETGTRFWRSPKELTTTVQLRNLFGTPADDHTIKGTLYVSPFLPIIPGFHDFTFLQPEKKIDSFNESFGEIQTDEEGSATFDLNVERYEASPLRITFVAEGFEKGSGRSVSASQALVVATDPYLVGYKANGDLGFIHRDGKRAVQFVAVSGDLKRAETETLSAELIEKTYVSVLQKQANGNLAYQSVEKKTVKSTTPFKIPEDGASLDLPTSEPGNFVYEIKNSTGAVISRIPFTVVGDANLSRSLERTSELQVKLSKDDYAPDEEIELQIQAPFAGSGLITLEQNRIYASQWFKTETTNTVQKIKVPHDLEGNGYVTVTFVRSLSSPEIFVSPLSYGVKPFTVSRGRRTQKIDLQVPSKIKPGDSLTLTYSSDRATKMALFAVDQGILQVAKYKAPDPLSYFFKKRALEVGTSQILDLLLPEYKIVQGLSAPGGDEEGLLGRFRNPFKRPGQKPIAFWSGIVHANTQPQDISFPIPDYFNGTVKVFAVAVDNDAIGVVEKESLVQGDLVLSPTVPLFTAPGDEFEVNTVVTNISSTKDDIEVKLLTDSRLSVIGDSSRVEKIQPGKDAVVYFKVRANDTNLGVASVKFSAQGSSEATYSLDLSVRPASPRENKIQYGFVPKELFKGKTVDISLAREMYPQLSERSMAVSSLPVSLLSGLANYLDNYPFGCTEQLASKGYPALIFMKDPRLGVAPADAVKTVERIIAALGARQKEDGSFSMWQGIPLSEPFLSVHIIRFLVEAAERGASVPQPLMDESYNYLRTLANGTPDTIWNARARAYAIYLLTRKGEVTTSYLQALRASLERIPEWQRDTIGLFMASSYKMLHLDSEAEALRKGVKYEFKSAGFDLYHDALAHKAHILFLLSKHFPETLSSIPPTFIEEIVKELQAQEYTTISSALLVTALHTYFETVGAPKSSNIKVSGSLNGKDFSELSLRGDILLRSNIDEQIRTVRLTTDEDAPLFYEVTESGFDKKVSDTKISNGLEIIREYRDESGSVITSCEAGDNVEVRLLVRSMDNQWYQNVAITDLLPSGFELVGGTEALRPKGFKPNDFVPQFVDATEDRALLFGGVGPTVQEFRYIVKAVSKGSFVTPPVQIEGMYNQKLFARGSAGRFEVK